MKKENGYRWLGKYFLNENCVSKDMIGDLKNNIAKNINDNGNYLYERLYSSSMSIIYYPNKLKKFEKSSILLVTHELSRTGAPVVVLDTAKVLINNGYFVTVISPVNGPLLRDFLEAGIPVVIMNEMKYVQYLHTSSINLLPKIDLDVFVDCFDLTIMVTATLFSFVSRYLYTNKKIIWWIHEGSASYDFLDKYMPRFITPNVKVVCGGEYAVNQIKIYQYNYYPTVLNYGVYDEVGNKKHIKNKNGKVRFLLAGTVGTRKGQLILLDAIEKLSNEYQSESEFIFVGVPFENDIAGIEIMKKLDDASIKRKNVKVLESISREQLYELYKEIDVLVVASLDDPMPVVATENLMLSNICLCSTKTGTSYYIEDGINGFVFQSENVLELVNKIKYIIDNKNDLDRIKKQGRKIYENFFSMEIFEKNLLRLVEEEKK